MSCKAVFNIEILDQKPYATRFISVYHYALTKPKSSIHPHFLLGLVLSVNCHSLGGVRNISSEAGQKRENVCIHTAATYFSRTIQRPVILVGRSLRMTHALFKTVRWTKNIQGIPLTQHVGGSLSRSMHLVCGMQIFGTEK